MPSNKVYLKLQSLKPYFFLFVILFISYLPLSSLHFAMKNDAFSDNFPDKYFLSQALHAGVLPLWNPYMNFGFPIYADPGFAFWNPITWCMAYIGYNAYTLTIEVLLYLYFAGITMFNLCRYLKFSKNISVAVAAMYMCSGFFSGSIQYINFLTAAAFLPLLLQSFLLLLTGPSLKSSAKFSLCFYCILMSGHPAIPVTSVYFLAILFAFFCIYNFRSDQFKLKKVFLFLGISIILTAMIAAPMLYSYASVWSFYNRNMSQQNFEITNIGFSLSSLISFLFPYTTTAHSSFFNNDVAMRNIYFSLFGFISLFFAFKQKNKLVNIFFITAILMLILSFGGSFKTTLYSYLPGLKYIRTNGELRVFPILLFALISGFALKNISTDKTRLNFFKKIVIVYVIDCVLLLFASVIIFRNSLYDFLVLLKNSGPGLSMIKTFLDNETFTVAFLVSLVISIIICLPLLLAKKDFFQKIIIFIILDLAINSIIYLPVTGVGTVNLSQVQSIYDANPNGIPVPQLIPINKTDTLDTKTTGLVGNISYYNKQIGTTKLTDYPSYFASTDAFFKSPQKDTVLSRPYVFLLSGNKNINVLKFSPQHVIFEARVDKTDSLIFLQNHYTYWKAFNNNKQVDISRAFTSFMSVPLSPGNNKIEIIYKDDDLIYYVLISLSALILITIIFVRSPINNKSYASTTSVLLR